MKTIVKSFCFLAACLLLSGCEKKFGEGVTLTDIAQGATSIRLNVGIGETGRLYAYPLPYDCTDYEFKWESADPNIAVVDEFGRVESIDVGNTTVSVSYGNIRKEYSVEVYEVGLAEKLQPLGVKGVWQFQDANNLFKASVGPDLIPVGSGFTQTEGFNRRTKAVSLPCSQKVNDVWQHNHLIYNHGFAANGGGAKVNEFTVLIDCMFPGGPTEGSTWTNGKYYCLYQTTLSNTGSDGDFFWRPGADFGITGLYTADTKLFVKDKWYRFIISVQLGKDIRYYLNGAKRVPKEDGLGEADNERAWNLDGVLLFADDDGENGQGFPLLVANLAIFDRALTDDEIKPIANY